MLTAYQESHQQGKIHYIYKCQIASLLTNPKKLLKFFDVLIRKTNINIEKQIFIFFIVTIAAVRYLFLFSLVKCTQLQK